MKLRHLAAAAAALFATAAFAAGDQQSAPQAQTAQQALSPGLIRQVQEQLNAKGHDAGPVDGIYGPLTQRALRNFQEAQDALQPSGRIDGRTLGALGIGSAAAGGTGEQPRPTQTQKEQ